MILMSEFCNFGCVILFFIKVFGYIVVMCLFMKVLFIMLLLNCGFMNFFFLNWSDNDLLMILK